MSGGEYRVSSTPAIDFTIGRVTNEDLEQAVAVWFKDEDEVGGEAVGPVWIQVGGSAPDADRNPMPNDGRLVPFRLPERPEWFEESFAAELAGALGLPVVWS
jgi:hypothetical protein